jgi:hypothetical protein
MREGHPGRRRGAGFLALALFLTAAGISSAHTSTGSVWMAGPGCGGRFEWFQHPGEFPYFCDGSGELEEAHWSNWGSPEATASATMNEAVVNSHNTVANAPRRRSAVTVLASEVKVCGGRHAYTRIVIRFHKAVNGIKKLHYGSLLPKCATAGQSANAKVTNFLSPDRKVWCVIGLGTGFCGVGGPSGKMPEHSAHISKNGKVSICSVAVPSLKNACLQNWASREPVLNYGEWTEAEGIRCESASDGITCLKVAGPGKGHGFRVNRDEAVRIGASGSRALVMAAAAGAPCTGTAIRAALRRSKTGAHLVKRGFKCAGRFAYAEVVIGGKFEAVELLRSNGRRWQVVNRAKYCKAGVVPASIRHVGCEVS